MEILLDTHIFLWYINGDKQLSGKYCDLIRDYKNNVYISPVSIWECIIKQELGKLTLKEKAGSFLVKEREKHKFQSLPLIEKDIYLLHKLPDIHKDPFDRLLICQALSNDFTFLTEDSLVKKYEFKSIQL